MIGWQCLFCGTSIAAWNALDVITVELYPTNQRSVPLWASLWDFLGLLWPEVYLPQDPPPWPSWASSSFFFFSIFLSRHFILE